MPEKTVKISFKPAKWIFFLLLAAAIVAAVFWLKPESQKNATNERQADEIVLLPETGVADSGFELESASITALNAKTILDTLEGIDGKQSLKIYFMSNSGASVKIGEYLNSVEKGNFYRLSFWAKADAAEGKNIRVNIGEEGGSQYLGDFFLDSTSGTQYREFNFQAEDDASDLILVSADGKRANIWLDNVLVEKIDVDSPEQLKKMEKTVFGDTSRFNVDQFQLKGDADSENFFSVPDRKMGQIFQPTQPWISGIALKIQKKGDGGTGDYHLQIREYDEKLGIISDETIASRKIYTDYPAFFLDQIKEKEAQMREEFDQKESDIREGRIPNDPTVDQYPSDYTQKQIDDSKAQKRRDSFALAVSEMKEAFNVPYELNIPISAKLEPGKKYWIGIDSADVKTTKRNFIKVFFAGQSGAPSGSPAFVSQESGVWREYRPLYFKTFYPKHAQAQGENILSGATISDLRNKSVYRYRFSESDYLSLSGFPGRKIYDLFESNFEQSDKLGNYSLSDGQFAIYRFNALHPVKKVVIRNIIYNQSLAVDFSSDGKTWKEIISDDPEEDQQSAGPLVVYPDSQADVFYLKIMPAGSFASISELDLEAELE